MPNTSTKSLVVLALVGAWLMAGAAAGPIVPVAEAEPSQYVFVKLMFEGHDQPNFDKWHANATAEAVAEAAGVPVRYLIRMVDGQIPGTKQRAPSPEKDDATTSKLPTAAAPAPEDAKPVAAPALVVQPVETPAVAAPVAATPVPIAPQPAPVTAAPEPAAAPTPAAAPAPAPAPTTPTTVSLITTPPSAPQVTQSEPAAVKVTPESGSPELPVDGPIETPASATQPQARPSLWQRMQQQQQDSETRADSQRPPRVFVIGGRRLMAATQAPNEAVVEYAIKTNASEPWAVREVVKHKLIASTAGFGMAQGTSLKGFYSVLREHGVGYYPSMWVDGDLILSGQMALDAPPNRFINGTTKNFQHKLYKYTDLVKPKARANTTNVTIAEPAFIMANRSTNTEALSSSSAGQQSLGLPPWAIALIVLGVVALAVALAGTVWRVVKQHRAQREEEDAAHSEPLSPQSQASHVGA